MQFAHDRGVLSPSLPPASGRAPARDTQADPSLGRYAGASHPCRTCWTEAGGWIAFEGGSAPRRFRADAAVGIAGRSPPAGGCLATISRWRSLRRRRARQRPPRRPNPSDRRIRSRLCSCVSGDTYGPAPRGENVPRGSPTGETSLGQSRLSARDRPRRHDGAAVVRAPRRACSSASAYPPLRAVRARAWAFRGFSTLAKPPARAPRRAAPRRAGRPAIG